MCPRRHAEQHGHQGISGAIRSCFPAFLRGVFALLVASTAAAAEPHGLNLANLSGWKILLPGDAIPSEKYAAEELQRFYKEATDINLSIVSSASEADRHIQLGPVPRGQSNEFGPEDFLIVIDENRIAISGGRPRGTLYGVYTFLEDYLGVRFLTADHTYVPKAGAWRVVSPVNRTYQPPLAFRWSYWGENNQNPPFAARLRNNTIGDDPKLGGRTGRELINHSFGRLIPSQKYGKEHPEYFAEIDGKRQAPVENDWTSTEPCLTNPDVLKIVTQAVLDELKANPKRENISVSQNDNARYCRCAKCKAIDDREDTPMGCLLTFVNAVAEAVEKQYPHVKVGTLSYWYTRKPPKNIRPRPNVQIQLCSIECCELHPIDDPSCAKNRAFNEDVENWSRICPDVSIWNYNVNFSGYQLPFPNLAVIQPNIRYFVAHNAHGVFMQAAGDTIGAAFSDLHNYVISNLLWDPSRDGGQLRDEFLRLHYGKAATTIRGLIEQIEERARKTGHHPTCFPAPAHLGIDQALADSALAAFADATQRADDDAVRTRVEKASICAYRMAIEPVFSAKPDAKIDPATTERMRPLAKQFFTLCKKHSVTNVREGGAVTDAEGRIEKVLAASRPAG